MAFGMYLGYKMRDGMPSKSFFYMENRKPVQEILDLIKAKYVDDVDINTLADTAIAAILSKLDPHSQYIPAKSVDQANEDIAGSFYGIGIEFNMFEDTLHVVNVLKNSPAEKAGMHVGDKLLQAGDSVIAGRKKDGDDIKNILKGDRGSKVNISLLRGNKKINVVVERDNIPVTSIDAAYMIDKTIGYIRLNRFSQKTYREFMESLEKLKNAGMKKLIFDLRGNGGGVLDEAVEIADEFLEDDRLITYTEGKHFPKKDYRSRRKGQFESGQVVVLADEGSASASEVLMGALQDWDRATIVGRKTFGKGLVQEQYDLSDKSALRLTVSRYYTPLGRSIQRSYESGSKAYYEEAARRFSVSDSTVIDSIMTPRGKVFKTRNGKTVYEGGGITPDVYITADTARFGKITAGIYARGLVNDFGYKYVTSHSDQLKKYTSPAGFATEFTIDQEGWDYFTAMAAKDSLDIKGLNVEEKRFMMKALKLAIARQLWRHEGYFVTFNKEDEGVLKAIEILSK